MAGTFTALRIFMSLIWFSNGLAKLIDKGTYDWGFLSVNLVTQVEPPRVRWRSLVLGRIKGMGAAKKYPVELRTRAVGMVRELEGELGPGRGAIARVARQLGLNPETLRGLGAPRREGGAAVG